MEKSRFSLLANLFSRNAPAEDLDSLKEAWYSCKKCDFWPARTNVVFWDGTEEAEVVFLGQYPGKREDETGNCFIGPAGKLCRDTVAEISQIPSRKQLWTNTLCCRPPDGVVKRQYVKNCSELLLAMLEIVRPKLVVVMGQMAVKGINRELGKNPLHKIRRKVFYYSDLRHKCVVTIFPAAYLRQAGKEGKERVGKQIREDFEFVGKLYDAENG